MKTAAFVLLLVLGAAISSPTRKPKGVGAAKRLAGRVSPYIIGGDVVEGREFPGQISLQVYNSHNCGGSIVNENYILTAAHCAQYSPSDLNVLSGTNSLLSGGTRHKVLKIQVHEKYNESDSWHNDLSVMKVDPPFVFDDITSSVTLPEQGQTTPIGSSATVIGWGLTSEWGDISNDLLKANIFISDHDVCNDAYTPDGLKVYPEQICADTPEGGVGSCNGDSGGPLFVNGQVVGLVSWARGCDEKGFPTVYTEVADYADWIESKINA